MVTGGRKGRVPCFYDLSCLQLVGGQHPSKYKLPKDLAVKNYSFLPSLYLLSPTYCSWYDQWCNQRKITEIVRSSGILPSLLTQFYHVALKVSVPINVCARLILTNNLYCARDPDLASDTQQTEGVLLHVRMVSVEQPFINGMTPFSSS